jgi:hypothetical protein
VRESVKVTVMVVSVSEVEIVSVTVRNNPNYREVRGRLLR